MANKKDVSAAFRRKIAAELRNFATTLSNHAGEICQNSYELVEAASRCISSKHVRDGFWGYEVNDLQFKIKPPQKIIPNPAEKYLDVHVNFKIGGSCSDQYHELINNLEFNIIVATPGRTHISSWHFDRHIEPDGEGVMDSDDAHPLYHFQYGGRNLSEIDPDYGKILVMPAPRIGHPPMDIVLAIDFVLSNFAGGKWRDLRELSDYRQRVSTAQVQYWKPYLESIFSWWDQGPKKNAKFSNSLWPHLVD